MRYNLPGNNTNTSTNSSNQPGDAKITEVAAASKPTHPLLKYKNLALLALPLALAVGCATDADRTAVKIQVPPTYAQLQEVNRVVGQEIFNMFLTDTRINYPLSISVNNGGQVILTNASKNKKEGQRVVNQVWALAGVTQVHNEYGVYLASTLTPEDITLR